MENKELIIEEGKEVVTLRNTDRVLQDAKSAAKSLKQVLQNKPKPVIINKEQYLEFEDWQTLGQFYGYTVKTGNAEPVEIEGVKGAKANADLYDRNGIIVGGAEAYCLRDEKNWGDKPWFQLASMAQTRAGAKAFRNRLSWVAVLAGFKPTPAEEMQGTSLESTHQRPQRLPTEPVPQGTDKPTVQSFRGEISNYYPAKGKGPVAITFVDDSRYFKTFDKNFAVTLQEYSKTKGVIGITFHTETHNGYDNLMIDTVTTEEYAPA